MRLSFCTTCMNRLEHLKQTLPANISLAKNPLEYEFVLLDYNSTDGLEQWIHDNFQNEIKSGLLVYFRTIRPQHFFMSHAKNVAHLLASSEIVCNLDADNLITESFLIYLDNIFKYCNFKLSVSFDRGNVGSRLALKKSDFISIGGYNEDLCHGWGAEDSDLNFRLNHLEFSRALTVNITTLGSDIFHGDETRNINTAQKLSRDESAQKNTEIMLESLRRGKFYANYGRKWGYEIVKKNFSEKEYEVFAGGQRSTTFSKQIWIYSHDKEINKLESLSIASMLRFGFEPCIISEFPIRDLPAGVRQVLVSDYLDSETRNSINDSLFLEYFVKSIVMLKYGGWSMDLDIVLLGQIADLVTDSGYLFFAEDEMILPSVLHMPANSIVMNTIHLILQDILEAKLPEMPVTHLLTRCVEARELSYAARSAKLVQPFNVKEWQHLIKEKTSLPRGLIALHSQRRILQQRGIKKRAVFDNTSILGRLFSEFKI